MTSGRPAPVYQPTAVAPSAAPPPPTFMTVPVPMGVFPGMTVVVQAPTGQRLAVIVLAAPGRRSLQGADPALPPPQIRQLLGGRFAVAVHRARPSRSS